MLLIFITQYRHQMHLYIGRLHFLLIWTHSRAYIVFLLFKCNVKWSTTPLMSSLGANLEGTVKCCPSHLSSFVSCLVLQLVLSRGWALFLVQQLICYKSWIDAINAASWGPSRRRFFFILCKAPEPDLISSC